MRGIWALIRRTLSDWYDDRAPRLGAALAYYTVFALAPSLVIVIGIAGLVLGREVARGTSWSRSETWWGSKARRPSRRR